MDDLEHVQGALLVLADKDSTSRSMAQDSHVHLNLLNSSSMSKSSTTRPQALLLTCSVLTGTVATLIDGAYS
eukprot:3269557-Amphidinium_carterae.2